MYSTVRYRAHPAHPAQACPSPSSTPGSPPRATVPRQGSLGGRINCHPCREHDSTCAARSSQEGAARPTNKTMVRFTGRRSAAGPTKSSLRPAHLLSILSTATLHDTGDSEARGSPARCAAGHYYYYFRYYYCSTAMLTKGLPFDVVAVSGKGSISRLLLTPPTSCCTLYLASPVRAIL